MDDQEVKQPPEALSANPARDTDVEQGPREQLLFRLIVGQTISVTAIAAMTAIGGLLSPESNLLALMPLGAIGVIVGLISYWVLQKRLFRLAGYVFMLGTSIAITTAIALRGYQDASALYYLWPIVGAVLILQARGGILVAAISTVLYLGLVVVQGLGLQPVPLPYDPQEEVLLTVGSRVIMFFLLAYLAWLSRQSVNRALEQARQTTRQAQNLARQLQGVNQTLEQRVAERTQALQAAAEVSRATIVLLDPDDLMRQTVDLVRERFNLYYVGLFIVDEEEQFAMLRAGTGEAGQLMLAQAHGLEVGGDSMIGRCISGDEAIIALDIGEQAVRFDNPLLPQTRSEMALPLRSRSRVIGAMTVQSAQEVAFDEASITVMQNMADQVAAAIDNARLYAQTQAALQEAEAMQQRYLERGWARYTTGRQVSGYEQTGDRVTPLGNEALPEVQWMLRERRPLVLSDEPSTSTGHLGADQLEEPSPSQLAVPIILSGQPIGALGVKAPEGGRQWSEEDVALVEAVAEQLGLAAENLRLLDETQRRAASERITREITDRMRRTADMDTLLQIAVERMATVLGASGAFAQLSLSSDVGDETPPTEQDRAPEETRI